MIDLTQHQDNFTGKSLAESKVKLTIDKTFNKLTFGYPITDIADELAAQYGVDVDWKVDAHAVQANQPLLKNVKNIIAVASGKGGVGKSTTTANLAIALAQAGAKVGVLDADIYGPSQPLMLGSYDSPDSKDQKTIEPIERHGIQFMSIGNLVDSQQALIWRGPMVSKALQQILRDTQWRDLDYLFVDLPPGTGDIQLTLSQKIPVAGAIVVTTPQDLSLIDARRAIAMFDKVKIPTLGIIENMSTHICSECGHEEAIFGVGGGEKIANEFEVPLLGQLPLDRQIRHDADTGIPITAQSPDNPISQDYRDIARKAAALLSLRAKDYSLKFPNIVVEKSSQETPNAEH